MEPPLNPAGEFVKSENLSQAEITSFIEELDHAPASLRNAVADLTDEKLDTKYRNWTIRQIVHHLADSHVNSYIRFKWALTEDRPTIKAYFEDRWVSLEDSKSGPIDKPLTLYEAIHSRWVQLLRTMQHGDFARSFVHPESGQTVRLDAALSYYPWHARHHTGQILWLRKQHGW
jgi:uncharacterized damage-inducible protein DinB